MMHYFRIVTIFLLPILQTVFLVVSLKYPSVFFWFAGISIIITDIAIAFLIKPHTLKQELFVTSIPSLALLISVFGVILFIESPQLTNVLVGIHACIQLVYFINLYLITFKKNTYQERLFAHISNACNTLSVYFLSSCLFALIYYLDIHFWKLSLVFIGIVILFYSVTLKRYNLDVKIKGLNLLFLAFLAGEMALILHWNSFPWYIASLVYTALYSTFEQLSIAEKLHELSLPKIITHCIVLAGVIVLSIATTL